MRVLTGLVGLVLTAGLASAQFTAVGLDWNQTTHPQVSGFLAYGQPLAKASGTYSFTVLDIVSKTAHPFTTTIVTTTGLAQFTRNLGGASIYVLGTVGAASGGSNVGMAWTSGGLAWIPISKGGFALMPNLRVISSSINQGKAFQLVAGIGLAWGGK